MYTCFPLLLCRLYDTCNTPLDSMLVRSKALRTTLNSLDKDRAQLQEGSPQSILEAEMPEGQSCSPRTGHENLYARFVQFDGDNAANLSNTLRALEPRVP